MNQYFNLLEQLLVSTPITITSEISESNLRKGLKKSLQDYNDSQAIMEMPEEERILRISRKKSTEAFKGTYLIDLIDKDSPRGGAFTFEIVEEPNNGST